MMKKLFLLVGAVLLSVFAIGQTVTDSTATVTYAFGDSLLEFLKENWKALVAVALFFASEWAGETNAFPEGSIWRKLLNWVLELLKKQVTKSPKQKKIGDYDWAKTSKILIFALVLSGLGLSASAQKAHPFRIYPFKQELRGSTVDSTVFFGASVSFDVFTKEIKTGDYSVGAIPGVGYGIKWNPKWNPLPTKSLVSLDVFAQAALDKAEVAQYFSIKLLPMVGILDWVHVGYGPVFKLGVNGTPGYNTGMFAISITTTL